MKLLPPNRTTAAIGATTAIALSMLAASPAGAQSPNDSFDVAGAGWACTVSMTGDASTATCNIAGDDSGLVDLDGLVVSLQAEGVGVDEHTPMVVEARGGSGGISGPWLPAHQGVAATASSLAAINDAVGSDGVYRVNLGRMGTTGHSGAGGSSTMLVANTPNDPVLDDVVVLAGAGGGAAGYNDSFGDNGGAVFGGGGGVVSDDAGEPCGDGDYLCAAGLGPNNSTIPGGGDPFNAGSHEVGGFGGSAPGADGPVTFQNPSVTTWQHGNGGDGLTRTQRCPGLGGHWYELRGHSGGGGGGFPGGAGGSVDLSCPGSVRANGGGGGGSVALAPTESYGDYSVAGPEHIAAGSLTITFLPTA